MRITQPTSFVLVCLFAAGCAQQTNGSSLPATVRIARTVAATAPVYKTLASIKLYLEGPASQLLSDGDSLIGATPYGGTFAQGAVFSVDRTGTVHPIYSFKGVPDGRSPSGSVTDVDGSLYGTTVEGGTSNQGTIFSISSSGVERVVHSFSDPASPTARREGFAASSIDGTAPTGGLIYFHGRLYGTTTYGGHGRAGTVFSMSLDGREQVLHAFGAAKDGALPAASLLQWNDALYGTTGAGGTNGCGTVFRVSANGQVETIHRFQNTPDACTSQAKLVESNGKLYGTSVGGGKNGWGTVFEITPSGAERVLLSFSANPSGYGPSPNGLVALNGNLYGTTASSDPNGGGTIFELTPSNTETILHNFGRGRDGSSPRASMTVVGNTLFGTTASGGAYHDGTVFQLQL